MKVGDKYIVNSPSAMCLPYEAGDVIEITRQSAENKDQFLCDRGYYYSEEEVIAGHLSKFSESFYSEVEENLFLAGDTEIRWAGRRKKGQRQLVIKYRDSSQAIACVQEKDIPKLAAALMEFF